MPEVVNPPTAENVVKVKSGKSKSGKEKSKKEKSGKTREREPAKKAFKIVVRKLPVRNFPVENFTECVDRACSQLGLSRDHFIVEQFIDGKLRLNFKIQLLSYFLFACAMIALLSRLL
jgi:hypothetical protein